MEFDANTHHLPSDFLYPSFDEVSIIRVYFSIFIFVTIGASLFQSTFSYISVLRSFLLTIILFRKQNFREIRAAIKIPLDLLMIVPTPSLVGREKLYTQMVFFCLFNFGADRNIHRREFCVVSLKSTYILAHENEKILSNFVFYRELTKFKFCENSTVFIYNFSMAQLCYYKIKKVKIFNDRVLLLPLEIEERC